MKFKRIVENDFLAWKNKSKYPLIILGARQVGKTSFLKEMGKKYYANCVYLNFEEKPDLADLFINTKEVNRLVPLLSTLTQQKINSKTLIIFDEIQECAEALNALKYFAENDKKYNVACAGSLLGVAMSKKGFPVGKVAFLNMYPLTFEEYIENKNSAIKDIYQKSVAEFLNGPLPAPFFNLVMEEFKYYLLCGGMPEPLSVFSNSQEIEEVNDSLKRIEVSYRMDFRKHTDDKTTSKINFIWDSLPSQLARENKRFLYQIVKEGARAREYEDALIWLQQSGMIYKVHKVSKPALPLKAYQDLGIFKIYAHDVGVLRHLSGLEAHTLLLQDRLFTEFKGSLTENFVCQSLVQQFGNNLHYWSSEGIAEVDFLMAYKNDIIPIEVKADKNIRSKSLAYFNSKFEPKIRLRYSANNFSIKENLVNIPLCFIDKTKAILDGLWNRF